MSLIESVYKEIHPTGILHILVNDKEKWLNYQINRVIEDGKLEISFFYDTETQPGFFEEWEEKEFIDIASNFKTLDYLITSTQEDEQITIICIPKKLFIEHTFDKLK